MQAKNANQIRRVIKAAKHKTQKQQLTLADCFGYDDLKEALNDAIEASGDSLIDKAPNIIRFAFQNINGISLREGLHVMPEVATIGALQIDIAAFTETNHHWDQSSRDKVTQQLYSHLGNS